MTSEGFAPAKINLTLHVTGQQPDGYHLLDSLVLFADVGDRLWFEPKDELSLKVIGPFAEGVPADHTNIIWKAAEMAQAKAEITVEKNLPHGAGIGGGSSDAAAVLRHYDVHEGAALLGADVPVCLMAKAQRMRGIGDMVMAVEGLPPLFAVLANPGVHVPTPEVFKALKQKNNASMPDLLPTFATPEDCIQWLATQRNDLQDATAGQVPVIKDVLSSLEALTGAQLVRMSGSGATCFALFLTNEEAQAAATKLAEKRPDWWVKPCVLS